MPKAESPYILDLARYQQEQLERFEDQIRDAQDQLGEAYAGDHRASNENYAQLAKKLLKAGAWTLFAMQVFPYQLASGDPEPPHENSSGDSLMGFKSFDGQSYYLDLNGTINYQPKTVEPAYDLELSVEQSLLSELLTPVDAQGYRAHAREALDALWNQASSHAKEILPLKPVFSVGDMKVEFPLPKAA